MVQADSAAQSFLELVLNIEQPHANGGGEQCDRQVYENEGPPADKPCGGQDDEGDGEIGAHRAEPRSPARKHGANREPVLNQKEVCWAEAKHHQRIAVNAIGKTLSARALEILTHC